MRAILNVAGTVCTCCKGVFGEVAGACSDSEIDDACKGVFGEINWCVHRCVRYLR